MLKRRELTLDWMSEQVYRVLPLSPELQRMKELFPEECIWEKAKPFYSLDMGRTSEDPILQAKILFLSFFYDIKGDTKTLETLTYRMDWRQFCDLPLDAQIPTRTTLVKFRRCVGLAVIEGVFQAFLDQLVERDLLDCSHRFFDGTPVKARASINPYRDEIYEASQEAIKEKLHHFHDEQIALDPSLNSTPVNLTKTAYAPDNAALDARRAEPMKSVADRTSAGDPDARFQRGKHGKPSELGYEIFFSTDGKQLFIEDVQVSEEASQGQQVFLGKLEQSEEGQTWSTDAEFSTGEILKKAEEKKVIVNTPARQVTTRGLFPKTEFVYDADTDSYTCPHGQGLSHRGTNHKTGERHYRPERGTCDGCPMRDECTRSKTGRTVTRNKYEEQLERQREHARTPHAVMGKVLRGIIAEGKFAEAVRHGLKTLRYVGREMAVLQSTLVAFILNIKRLIRLEGQGVVRPVGEPPHA
jgi:transposase